MSTPSSSAAAPQQAIADFINSHGTDLTWQRPFYEDLHANPELSHEEERTAGKILERLDAMDCEVVSGIGGHGIVAIFRNGEGPSVLMRADFDALPVKEESGLSYASTNDYMHACGHDMHATALMGVCEVLNAQRQAWTGTFLALFQPAEETSVGAKYMIADDLVSRVPAPDICLGQHVLPGKAGLVMSKPGPVLAGCDSLRIRVTGRSAHASMPHNSIDPTFLAAMIVVRLQGIVGREVAPHEFFVISVGELHSGDKNNIIPDYAELVLNTRYYDTALAERVYASLERMVRAECEASGCTVEPTFEFFAHGEVTDNDPAADAAIRPTFDSVFGELSITTEPSTASEDFCYLPQAWGVPYYYWFIGSTPESLMDNPPVNHQANFIPEYEPTADSSTKAGLAAVLTYLHR